MRWEKEHLPLCPLAREEGQFFFGYYDLPAMRGDTHLAHKVPFADRLHRAGDETLLGTLPLCGGDFSPFDQTRAWCFQQGAMLQYLPDGRVLYNIETETGYGARVRNLETGKYRDCSRPAATVSGDGRFFLSINFARLYHFRPGYGYAGRADPFAAEAAPEEDGIFRVDIDSGAQRLLVSTRALAEDAGDYFAKGEKLCVNHLTLNPSGTRAIALVRNMEKTPWRTRTYTVDTETGAVFALHDETMMSHYFWEDDARLLAFCRKGGVDDMYRLTDLTRACEAFPPELFGEDGHMARRGALITYDSYPDAAGDRFLGVYDTRDGRARELARVYGPNPQCVDIRCDLHPRWHPEKQLVTIDSIHEGRRNLYAVDLSPLGL